MVSVIIPCHNCEKTIDRAIKSVLQQSYKHIEVILVNNNSTDNTFQRLLRYQNIFPGKIKVLDELKKGAPAARNTGIKKAQGEWIQLLDADDELLTSKLERQVLIGEENDADVVAGESMLSYISKSKEVNVVRHTDVDIWRGLITSNLGITSSNLWRKTALDQVNGWDEELSSSQEYDLLLRLLQNGAKIITDKAVNTIIHLSTNSVSNSPSIERKKEVLNNRIALRLRIREQLIATGQYTFNLERTIDNYIYTEILSYYKLFPKYAVELLKTHKPNVKFSLKLRLWCRLLFKKPAFN
ncbi:glycosyltransferase family A protein [Mucilaginibacter sp. CAU 1740]|uniref:glycosyltransferase family 2 protein n=1 Tax=Mucilaginibacter sp. CAU 1740 TaxID=3140365 RepID=UPI00325C021D